MSVGEEEDEWTDEMKASERESESPLAEVSFRTETELRSETSSAPERGPFWS